MSFNISGSFVDNSTPMSGNVDATLNLGIQGPAGPQGTPGGYYVPAIEQTGENELEVSFSPSLPDMPAVDPVQVELPHSGGNEHFRVEITRNPDGSYTADKTRTEAVNAYKGGSIVYCSVPVATGTRVDIPLKSCAFELMRFEGVYNGKTVTVQYIYDDSVNPMVDNVIRVEEVTLVTGNVVRTVNGIKPNAFGNVTINIPDSGGNVDYVGVEPADDDIPKVYFTGTLPTSKEQDDVRLTMHYISKTDDFIYPVTLKVQGSSSANYAKKNFTLKPYKDATYESKKKLAFKNWPEMNKFVLKAHWIDHSHVRNVGTAKIWGKIVESRSDYDSLPEELRNAPNNGATDGFTVKVFCNGVYQGLYEWIVPKDKLFGQDSDIATHSILNSEWNNHPTCAFATTSPVMSGNWSEELQDSLSSDISTSFANLIKFVAGATDEEFVANAENYFDVQSVIDFDIFARVFCIVDNLCRNQIFFTYDGQKWYEGCWDVDAVLGLPPTTRGFFAYNTEFQTGYIAFKDYGMTNLLYQRVENLFMERFKARYSELRSGVLSIENILDVYERLTDVITTYDGLLAEDYATTTGGGAFTGIPYKNENNIQQIRNFVAQRIPYMDEVIKNMIIVVPVHCTGVSLDKNTLTFTGEGTQTITATVTPSDTTDTVVWVSSDPDIATITVADNVCTVQSVRNGDAVVTVTCGSHSATCTVSVSVVRENLLNGLNFSSGYINYITGEFVSDTGSFNMSCEDYIPVKAGETYIANVTGVIVKVGSNPRIGIKYYDAENNYTGEYINDTDNYMPFEFTIPTGVASVRITFTVFTVNGSSADWTNAVYTLYELTDDTAS